MTESKVSEIGVPVRTVNRAALYAGHNIEGSPCLYATMSQQADNFFIVQIDPDTGATRQFTATRPKSNYTTAVFMSRTGKLYIGAAHSGHLFCFDPESDDLLDLGSINGEAAIFPCRIDEDEAGLLWIGSYGTADLTSYDPSNGKYTRYGRMNDVEMYNYPLVNVDGTIANYILQTQPHVVVLDPHTREKQVVGPVVEKGEGSLSMHRGTDRHLYITSSEGDFRIDGMEAIAVAEAIEPERSENALPDGRTFRFADEHEHRVVEIEHSDGKVETFDLKYEASGTDIFYLHAGPDGCVYGSSILPERLFRYRPQSDGACDLVDLGICSVATGEAYSMANLDGIIYISSYPSARISIYDPAKPYHFGEDEDANPRDIGPVDDLSYRPRATLTGPLGRVWTASLPDYGRWGGPLAWYDPATGKKKAYPHLFGDGSCYTLAHLAEQQLIAIGTTITGGSGTQPKVEQAALLLWNYAAEQTVWEGTLDRPVSTFSALAISADGKLCGTVAGGDADPEIFVFDPNSRAFIDRLPLPSGRPLDLGLQFGPDEYLYGFTSDCIYRLDLHSRDAEVLFHEPGGLAVAGPILDGRIYFASGHRLRSLVL